jgi:hypothetical protein
MEDKVQDQKQDDNRQPMPEEAEQKLDDVNHNMKEKTNYDEYNHHTSNDPNPGTERDI